MKAFDRHCNMVLEGVREIWMEYPKSGSKNQAVPKERMIPKMFLRGDSVIIIMTNPGGATRVAKEEGDSKMDQS